MFEVIYISFSDWKETVIIVAVVEWQAKLQGVSKQSVKSNSALVRI